MDAKYILIENGRVEFQEMNRRLIELGYGLDVRANLAYPYPNPLKLRGVSSRVG